MGLVAAREALAQARLLDFEERAIDIGTPISAIMGDAHGPCHETEIGYGAFFQHGPAAVRPTTVPMCMFNSLSSNISIHFGLTGSNHVIASACSSATTAIGLALLLIRHGYADVVLCGGADAPLTSPLFSSWTKLRVLAEHEDPKQASRPFDRRRNGLVLGEGAAIAVLESLESRRTSGRHPPGPCRRLWFLERRSAHHSTLRRGPGASNEGLPARRPRRTGLGRLSQSPWHGYPGQRRNRGAGRGRGLWSAGIPDAREFDQVDAGSRGGSQRRAWNLPFACNQSATGLCRRRSTATTPTRRWASIMCKARAGTTRSATRCRIPSPLAVTTPPSSSGRAIETDRMFRPDQANNFPITLPRTSVSRKSRPWKRYVSRLWSIPSRCRIVACKSWSEYDSSAAKQPISSSFRLSVRAAPRRRPTTS